ncbi:unnamed protein product [Protopolystoma xenopodis]|uniref:PPM-type phosphatase domain-containing protein n=1 Tax=Protopolystoma xenopodis TaxID=117903 RepID=A0A448XKW4_9PLAT|nr:unnamed protein product [Protopolystoma xenopodis]
MGAFLEKPKTEKHGESGGGNGIRYGVCSMQGYRVEMEDAHVAKTELSGEFSSWSYFGVFDGHAGCRVSELCADKLLDEFKKMSKLQSQPLEHELVRNGIVKGFLDFDHYLEAENSNERSGSTAVVAFVTPTHIILGNCGDSRAVLVKNNQPVVVTEDHKPYLPAEQDRISNAGGSVVLCRVNGSLAVSRSLGDFEYKQVQGKSAIEQLVSAEPDVTIIERQKDQDQLLILACDGVWDVYSNQELCDYVLQRLSCVASLERVSAEILDTSLHKGSRDNMSILLVSLDKAPSVDPDASLKDKELDAQIQSAIKDILDNTSHKFDCSVDYVAGVIDSMELTNYPPGGMITK